MSKADFVTRLPVLLRPNPARVVIRPYIPGADPDHARARRIVERVLALDEVSLEQEVQRLSQDFSTRHRDVQRVFLRRFREIEGLFTPAEQAMSPTQALLVGAYFSHEYSYEAAALFNPSIVPHPDQAGVPEGSVRFVLSLRGVGEGHISSITFRTGLCGPDGAIAIDPPGSQAIVPRVEDLPATAATEAGVRIVGDGSYTLSEAVIFPATSRQRNGIEDLRLVPFIDDDGSTTYFGTYTAYSNGGVRQELLRTDDFHTFDLVPLRGPATANKGMAMFPRRIAGRYAMLGRQDNENISFLTSASPYEWDGGVTAVSPRWPWEFVQIGNCGSPLEIDEGWLVITHGVGAVRNYALGVCLLDRDDPSRLLARMALPLIRSDADEREGYVPNVAYSCGAMIHSGVLILPYAIADSFTTFATVPIDRLLAAME